MEMKKIEVINRKKKLFVVGGEKDNEGSFMFSLCNETINTSDFKKTNLCNIYLLFLLLFISILDLIKFKDKKQNYFSNSKDAKKPFVYISTPMSSNKVIHNLYNSS